MPTWVAQPGCCRLGVCLSLCPAVAMPTPRLCLRMLYLISQVWNSNYVISQHRVAMTASAMSPGGSHLGVGGAKKKFPQQISTQHPFEG